jgi:hypothetical protein
VQDNFTLAVIIFVVGFIATLARVQEHTEIW